MQRLYLTKRKAFPRFFRSRGHMMNMFQSVNVMFESGNEDGLSDMHARITEEYRTCSKQRQHKYLELMEYCSFLMKFRVVSHMAHVAMAKKVMGRLNLDHELGRSIYQRLEEMCPVLGRLA